MFEREMFGGLLNGGLCFEVHGNFQEGVCLFSCAVLGFLEVSCVLGASLLL